ncbi:MAG: T9SS type A sorting domain-containing protein [Bacteroidota bacterium]|nr:T9SS type A sorting domain-containing protein [Bacteroidota bacterium]
MPVFPLSDHTQYHPVLYQSTDGGESWAVNPIHCQLGGPEGLNEVKQFVENEYLESLFGADYQRDSIQYSMGYHADMVVDVTGNVHITGIIAPADDTAWYPLQDLMGTFHVWYDHATDTWDAHLLNMNHTFMGENEGLMMYNNPGLSINTQGDVLFFTWNDTEMDGIEENIAPDIYMCACNIWSSNYSEVENITLFTQAMWTAHFATPSYYVFDRCPNGIWIFTIPLVYLEAIYEPTYPAKIWYIDGVEVWNWAYCNNVKEENASKLRDINIKPNPFSIQAHIEVRMVHAANLRLQISNILGQKVLEIDRGKIDAGQHEFIISSETLGKGIYFCSFLSDGETVSKKIIVK